MATHSSILAWRIPWTEEPGRLYSPLGHTESDTTEATWLCISSLKRSMLSTIKPYQTDSTVGTTERMELPLIEMGGHFFIRKSKCLIFICEV